MANDCQELRILTMIKIDFEFQTDFGLFRDALHLSDDHGLTDEQIDALKAQRRDNWLAIVTTPQEPVDGE